MTTSTVASWPAPTAPPEVDRCPYIGLVPFDEADQALFFGRERETDLIVANLTASRLTLLYAASGVGKSSVLRAGVLATARRIAQESYEDLGAPGAATVYVSDWSSPPIETVARAVLAGVRQVAGSTPIAVGPAARLDADWWRRVREISGVSAIHLVLSQFEEYFLYHGDECEGDSLVDTLGDVLSARDIAVNVVLSIREDALAELDRFKGRIPHLFGNYLRLASLDRHAGRMAIEGPLDHYNSSLPVSDHQTIEPGLVDLLLEQVEIGRVGVGPPEGASSGPAQVGSVGEDGGGRHEIEAPYLQLVLTRLWKEERGAGSTVLRRRTLEELGGAETIVRSHLGDVMAGLTAAQNEVAASVFHHLVTSSGSKIALTAEDLADWSALDVDLVQDLLESLSSGQQRILRPVPPPAGTSGPPRYEIYHDVMGAAVLEWRRRYVAQRNQERASHQLVDERERAVAEAATARHRLRRVRLVAVAMAMALVAVSVLGYVAVQRDRAARREGREAREQELLAVAAAQLPTDPAASLRAAVDAGRIDNDAAAREAILVAAAAPRGEVISGPSSQARDMVVTKDSEHVVFFDADGSVHQFGKTGSEEATARLAVSGTVVRGVVGEDGHTAALVTDEGQIAALDLASGRSTVIRASGSADEMVAVVRASSRILVATFGAGKPTELFDASSGELVARLEVNAWDVIGSPDGKYIVTSDDQQIRVRDASTGVIQAQTEKLSGTPRFLQWYGAKIVGVTTDEVPKHTVVWDWSVTPAPSLFELVGVREVQQARVDEEQGMVLVSQDKSAWSYDLADGGAARLLPSHSDWVYDAESSRTGRWVVTAGGDGRVLVWASKFPTLEMVRPTFELLGHHGAVLRAGYLGDGQTIVSIGFDGTVRRWRLPPVERSDDQWDWVLDLDASSDGRWLASASRDGTIHVLRVDDLTTVATIESDGLYPVEVRFDPKDPHTVYTLRQYDNAPEQWRWSEDGASTLVRHFDRVPADVASVWQFDVSEDAGILVGGDSLGKVHLWDTATGMRHDVPIVYDEPGTYIVDVAFDPAAPSGDRVAIATEQAVKVWSKSAPGSPVVLDGKHVSSVVFDRQGSHIAVAEDGGVVKIWTGDGHLLQTMQVRGERAGTPVFNSDGSLIAVGTAEGLIDVRDVASGRTVMLSRVHGDSVNDVAFIPGDDRHIVSGSDDTTVAGSVCEACGDQAGVVAAAQGWVASHP